MENFSISEMRLIISNSTKNNADPPYIKVKKLNPKIILHRANLIKTLKIYVQKYCQYASNKYNILYLSILYLDIILAKNKISLSYDKNLKYLCLCCFLLSLKFIGNFDISKKIIQNFSHNYKDEYKIFEIQCLILLEHNIIYSTAYDYINMILMKESKKILSISSSLLYKICEDSAFIYYSPFYISIAIVQLAKNSINDKSYNHYDKYFHDQRVKHLYKIFNYYINVPPQYSIKTDKTHYKYKTEYIDIYNNNINDNNNDNDNDNDLTDNIYYTHDRNSASSNINIITNNNIQNNIVIINDFSRKRTDKNMDYNNDINFSKRTCVTNKHRTPIKLILNKNNYNKEENDNFNNKIKTININKEYNKTDREIENNIFYKNNINTVSKNIILSKSYFNNNVEEENNYTNNSYRIIRKLKLNKNGKLNNQNCYYPQSSNNLTNYLLENNNNKNFYIIKNDIKMNDNNKYMPKYSSNAIQNESQNINNKEKEKICQNKSSLNFQLVSGVSKDKLVKLSRNLSKKFN